MDKQNYVVSICSFFYTFIFATYFPAITTGIPWNNNEIYFPFFIGTLNCWLYLIEKNMAWFCEFIKFKRSKRGKIGKSS
jgi:hypothetical protein